MQQLTRIFIRTQGHLFKQRYLFAKPEPRPHKNTNYKNSREPVVVTPALARKQWNRRKNPKKIQFKRYRQLILANLTLAGFIPFFDSVNAGIMILNGGFILSQIGHQIKKLLILVSNNHYKQLLQYQRPQQYLKLVMSNMLFLSISSILLAFHYYPASHLLTIGWYLFNILKEVLPEYYWYLVFPLLFIAFFSYMRESFKSAIYPSDIDMAKALQKEP